MGALESKFNSHDGKKVNPHKRLWRFPATRGREPGKVLVCFMPIQPGIGKKINIPDNATWSIDCKFLPYNELHLVTSVGVYIMRPGRRPHLPVSKHLAGALCVWKISNNIVCRHMKGCNSIITFPNVQTHPDGENILFAGSSSVTILNLLTGQRQSQEKDISNYPFVKCAISPNGRYIATMCRKQTQFEVSIFRHEGILLKLFTAFCHEWCSEFQGDRTYTHEVECKFSPDSAYVAVAISSGLLVVVKRAGLGLHLSIIPGMFSREGMRLVNAKSFEYDPRFFNRHLTFGGDDNFVYFLDLETAEVMQQTEITSGEISCIKHNEVGDMLAVATTEAQIFLLGTDSGNILQVLNGTAQAEEHAVVAIDNVYPTFTSLSFNTSGDVLASGSSDGFVRLWQVQPIISLQQLCRLAILQIVRVSDVVKLPLPPKLMLFLMQWPAR